jgi:hypothetical protein
VQRLAVEAIGQEEVLVIDARGELRAACGVRKVWSLRLGPWGSETRFAVGERRRHGDR